MLIFLFLLLLLLLLYPSQAASGAIDALQLCGTAVIPALLPYFVLTRLISSYLRLPPLVFSFLGGYPVGVSCVISMYEAGQLSKSQAQALLRVCNNSGPGFFVGVIGSAVLKSTEKALILYGIHVVSSLLCAKMYESTRKEKVVIRRLAKEKPSFAQQLQDAIGASCSSMLQVCVIVIMFSVLLSLLRLFLPSQLLRLCAGVLELTNGVLQLSDFSYAFILCAFFMGWGGLCVHAQAISLWQAAGLHVEGYFTHKLLHGLLSALLALCVEANYFVLAAMVCAIFVFFSNILKKWGRKMRRYAV